MNKKNAKLASWAAVLTAVLVLFTLFYMFRREGGNPGINLPPELDELSGVVRSAEEIASAGALELELIDITRENAAILIAALPRSDMYSGVGMTVVYGGGKSLTRIHHIHTLDGYMSIERYDEDGELLDKMIYTPEKVYMWLNEQMLEIARGAFSIDAAVLMPTYEDILDIEPEDIIGVKYMRDADVPHVWLRANIASMEIEYWVDLESGLLTHAIARQNGEVAWEFNLLELNTERPDDDLFLLPSGAYVWE
jgi:hypothetical protein